MSLVNYKNLTITSLTPTGDAGLALKDNFTYIADTLETVSGLTLAQVIANGSDANSLQITDLSAIYGDATTNTLSIWSGPGSVGVTLNATHFNFNNNILLGITDLYAQTLHGDGANITGLTVGQVTGAVASTLTISTTAPLTGGGALNANRTLAITKADATHDGYLSSVDWNTFNGKGSGSVTSVGLSLPNIFSISGSPVTSTGTLTGTLASQTTNLVFASPNGSTGAPTFRALVAADIPTLTLSKISDAGTAAAKNTGTASGTVPLLGTGGSLALTGAITTTANISAGTTNTYGAITAIGGTSFSSLPPFGTASIGHIAQTGGWDGSGFLFTNSTSGTKAFSMVFNVDTAFFGLLTGTTSSALGSWNATGLRIGDGNAATAALDVIGSGGSAVNLKTTGRIQTGASGTGGVWLDGATATQFVGSFDASNCGFFNSGWSFVVSSAGKVGIGTTNPTTAKLVITGTSATQGIDLSTSDMYLNARVIQNSNNSGDKDLYFGFQSGATSSLHLYSNNSETVKVAAGKVRVGDGTTPTETLDVAGNILVTNGAAYNGGLYSGDPNWGVFIQRTAATDDYNVRLSYTPNAGSTRRAGVFAVGTGWIAYANEQATPNFIVATKLGVGQTAPGDAIHVGNGSGNQYIRVDAGNTSQGFINFYVGATAKWSIGKNTDNSFLIFDNVGSRAALQVVSNGDMTLMGSGGKVGIGQTPTAILHLKAGTATANTAPLKFTAGTALTSAEAGTMEFSNSETGLTFTAVSTRRAVVLDTATQTLTNKRVTKRTGTVSSSATPTINTDNVDYFSITAQSGNITSMTTNLSGTPTEGQTLWLAMTAASGTPTITWGTGFESSTATLPTGLTTTRQDVGFIWNSANSKWRCVATA